MRGLVGSCRRRDRLLGAVCLDWEERAERTGTALSHWARTLDECPVNEAPADIKGELRVRARGACAHAQAAVLVEGDSTGPCGACPSHLRQQIHVTQQGIFPLKREGSKCLVLLWGFGQCLPFCQVLRKRRTWGPRLTLLGQWPLRTCSVHPPPPPRLHLPPLPHTQGFGPQAFYSPSVTLLWQWEFKLLTVSDWPGLLPPVPLPPSVATLASFHPRHPQGLLSSCSFCGSWPGGLFPLSCLPFSWSPPFWFSSSLCCPWNLVVLIIIIITCWSVLCLLTLSVRSQAVSYFTREYSAQGGSTVGGQEAPGHTGALCLASRLRL